MPKITSGLFLVPIAILLLSIFPTRRVLGFQLHNHNPHNIPRSRISSHKSQRYATVNKSDEEWKVQLSPDAYRVLRKDGTEAPWTSELNDIKEEGTFICAGCQSPLFRTGAKFDSGTGWPSFYAPIDENAVALSTDFKLVLPRTECRCAVCDGHLGHVFDDGPKPTGERYCMNGVSMTFRSDDFEEEGYVSDMVEREQKSQSMKPPLASVLPSSILYAGVAGLYGNSFLTRWVAAQDIDATFPSSVLDLFPVGLGGFCLYLSVKGLSRLF